MRWPCACTDGVGTSKFGTRSQDGQLFAAYVTDWAHYRPSPYTWSVSNLAPIANRLDVVMFSFIYFCPPAGTSPMPYWASAPYGSCTDASQS